ncbi:hypothetical protein [Reyranella sp.]|uniref:hypothetical protein n=1 Tax=Reyranella sp. TaxID=1929291 RepID=UPI00403739E4
MRSTDYADLLKEAREGSARIELLRLKGDALEAVRFSWWPNEKMALRPLDISEIDFFFLFSKALKAGVFSPEFKSKLRAELDSEE